MEKFTFTVRYFMDYEERIAWAINMIKKKHGLKDYQLARKWGVDKATVGSYCEGKGIAKGPVLSSIVKEYGISGEWLIAGHGEPFPGARKKYPEVCGPEDVRQHYNAPHAEHPAVNDARSEYRQIPIADDLQKTARVLESPTPYATALHLNINSFHRALEVEEKHNDINARFESLQNRLSDIEKRNDELSKEVIILRGQLSGDEDTSSGTG